MKRIETGINEGKRGRDKRATTIDIRNVLTRVNYELCDKRLKAPNALFAVRNT